MPPKGPGSGSGPGPVTIANKNGPAKGVLPVNPSAANHQHHQQAPTKSTIRLKLEVRRLPPGLTQDEFLDAFGPEWHPMKGKVDWFQYRSGKTKGPGKPSEQSRAYVKLGKEADIRLYETKFLSLTFHDAKGTHKDPQLKHLQPIVGFAPNQRVPTAKQRVDGRQGTIDQDPEFIAFLEGETQPVVKPSSLQPAADKDKVKVTSTPLLDDLREKKANKAKAASAKPSKTKDDKTAEKTPRGKESAKGANKSEPAKDAAKTPTKQAAKSAASRPPAPAAAAQQAGTASPAPNRKRGDRATPNAIKSMLQRDLGINTPNGKRGAKNAASDTASTTSQTPTVPPTPATVEPPTGKPTKSPRASRRGAPLVDKANEQPVVPDTPKAAPAAPSGILKKPAPQATPKGQKGKANATASTPSDAPAAQSPARSPAPPKPAKAAPQPLSGATKAYLKHTNASQGITEPLIAAALSTFGEVVKVNIDKRKGTAIAEFKDNEGLKAAMSKRSVPVAQGAVEVLEYRDKPAAPPIGAARGASMAPRGGSVRGRGRGGRGGAAAAATSPGAATAPASAPSPAPVTTAGGDAT